MSRIGLVEALWA